MTIEAEGPLSDAWSFRNVYGNISGLGERIENFLVTDVDGKSIPVRNVAPGEFRASRKGTRFTYQINLSNSLRLTEMSHVSWLNHEYGMLMPADLLPRFTPEGSGVQPLIIEFGLPAGWTVASSAKAKDQTYVIPDPDGAVFFVGRGLREKITRVDSMELALITVGEWPFKDSEALKIAERIVDACSKITQYRIPAKSVLMLAPFPIAVGADRWSAETRGSTVVLLMGRQATRGALLGRLGVVLTHELFHLWVPKGLSLTGDYDWFFEGFTLYQALLTALRLHFITFSEYLDTLGRVYDSYRSSPERDKLSLIEASERRWTSAASLVYEKGLLVAFLYDLMLRRASNGEASLMDIYPQLFQLQRSSSATGNELITSILDKPDGMHKFSELYVRSDKEIELPGLLVPFGLRVDGSGSRLRLVVNPALHTQQLRVLKSLGYKR
ncbi:MAG: hypothetical protein ABJB97_02435 [Acidobacteriota bacterium]